MGQKKLVRFEELKTFSNVFEFPVGIAGKWNAFFKNDHPITLELACGKGEYALGLGEMFPERNFIGIDLKGNRIWVGARKALQKNLYNIAFLRTQIDHISEYFSKNEVAEIWITFPDPQLRVSKAKKRLTHPKFLRLYQQFLAPGGLIHLKTDSPDLYQFTKLVIGLYGCVLQRDLDDVYGLGVPRDELSIKTHYESLDIAGSNRIHYLCFSLPELLPGKEKDETLKQLLKPASRSPEICEQREMRELIEGEDFYINKDGLVVLTERYHLEKGYCCGSGCLHCPYDYEKVEEPHRSELVRQSGKNNSDK